MTAPSASPAVPLTDAELDALADAIAYGIVLAAVAKLGVTRTALAAAFAAVVLSDAFEPAGSSDRSELTGKD
jgi:hypothetical protein